MAEMQELLERWERNRERYNRRTAEGKSVAATAARMNRLTAQVLELCREREGNP